MTRYHAMFQRLQEKKEGAFIPFVMLWDPDRNTSLKIISQLIRSGADALELGIAFSDPLADGPTIQKAGIRAINAGSTVHGAFDLIKEIRIQNPDIPIGILTYANLVFRSSLNWFYKHAQESGVDSVLIADVPVIEAKPFCQTALAHGVDPVLIAPQNMALDRIKDLASLARGYTYVVTRAGVTGANEHVALDHKLLVEKLHSVGAPPPVFGFGISTPQHVKAALTEGARGVICGSHIVSIIERTHTNPEQIRRELSQFITMMKAATVTQ